MTQVAAWVGAGVFTAGISAAMLAGAGTANADGDGVAKQDTARAATQNDSAKRLQHRIARAAKQQPKSEVSGATAADKQADTKQHDAQTAEFDRPSGDSAHAVRAKLRTTFQYSARDVRSAAREFRDAARTAVEDTTRNVTAKTPRTTVVKAQPLVDITSALFTADSQPVRLPTWRPEAAAKLRDASAGATLNKAVVAAAPTQNDPVGAIHDVLRTLGKLVLNPEPQNYPKPLSVLTDAVFGTLATLERIAGGDPVVPPELRDSVQVSTSTLVISPGHEVESNWYIPTVEEGRPAPTRLIYLQHGFLANGPIYSYTASYLAAQTNSIVVTTTFSSNPFAEDGMWLGGDNLHEAVAQLFLDPDRTALNASLDTAGLKAGRADNLDVPMQFVLVGHSLGGGFGPGVAGYYAEGLVNRREEGLDAPNDLAGVVTYDAVPMGSIVPDAMDRLDLLEANGTPLDARDDDPADYIPIYEIGAPLNYLNVFSDINDQLTQARLGQFTGVVLEGGVHMDPMQGGNPLIQVVAYTVAGFPQPQNPLAVRALSAGWINDMFDEKIDPTTGACATGATCAGQYGDGDDSFTISTAEGNAVAVLIGSQRATDLTSLRAISVTDFVSAIPAGVLNGLETTCDLFTGGNCPV